MNKILPKLTKWLFKNSSYKSDDTVLLTEKEPVSFTALVEMIEDYKSKLITAGLKEREKAAFSMQNKLEFIAGIIAVWEIGAVPVLINRRLTIQEINDLTHFSGSSILITDHSSSEKSEIKRISTAGIDEKALFADSPDDALYIFTSGSLGKPKCVVHSYDNLYRSFHNIHSVVNFEKGGRFLASLPFYHIGGLMIIIRALASGGVICIPRSIKTNGISSAIKSFDPQYISLVPTMLSDLIDSGDSPNKNIKTVFLGGGPASEPILKKFQNSEWPVAKVYGSTETSSMVTYLSPADFKLNPDSAGKPLPGCEISFSPGDEILVRSNTLFTNYYRDAGLYKKVVNNGCYNTGDIGYADKSGFIFIENRRKDLIVSGGENINPAEIESVLNEINELTDAIVFAEEDDKWGQIVCAAAALKSPSEKNIYRMIEVIKSRLPGFKQPKKYYIYQDLPRNDLGKIIIGEKEKKLALNVIKDI